MTFNEIVCDSTVLAAANMTSTTNSNTKVIPITLRKLKQSIVRLPPTTKTTEYQQRCNVVSKRKRSRCGSFDMSSFQDIITIDDDDGDDDDQRILNKIGDFKNMKQSILDIDSSTSGPLKTACERLAKLKEMEALLVQKHHHHHHHHPISNIITLTKNYGLVKHKVPLRKHNASSIKHVAVIRAIAESKTKEFVKTSLRHLAFSIKRQRKI